MLDKFEILDILKKQKPFLRDKFNVKEIGLFGSYARNEATNKSDIDFLIELFPNTENYIETKEALREYLRKLFGKNIDLANPRSLKPHFKNRILKQAVYA
jgi:predicted nucleotidyltransferase